MTVLVHEQQMAFINSPYCFLHHVRYNVMASLVRLNSWRTPFAPQRVPVNFELLQGAIIDVTRVRYKSRYGDPIQFVQMHLLNGFHCAGLSTFVSALGLLAVLAIGAVVDYVRDHQQRRRRPDQLFRLAVDIWNVLQLLKC